jgi:hypothetical protein
LTRTEFYKTVCDELSGISNTNFETAINVSRSDKTLIESTPLTSTSDGKTTRAGTSVRPPNRLQLNNLTVDAFTSVVAEKVRNQLG